MTAPATGSGTTTEERTSPQLGDGDAEKFAHYVRKEDIVRSAVTGEPVTALCGKKWIPNRNPERFPVCPACSDAYADRIISGDSS